MSGVTLTIARKAGEEGHLFGSVTAQDIVDALSQQNFTVERRKIHLEEPIKNTGEYKVPVRLHREVTQEITVNVVAE
jgi:large subunit ribosomal protein L9